jgi:hypothetical protein
VTLRYRGVVTPAIVAGFFGTPWYFFALRLAAALAVPVYLLIVVRMGNRSRSRSRSTGDPED